MVGPPPSSSSSSWRTPSVEIQQKYNVVELPESFETTPQENDLLKMYDRVRALEKEASRIKEDQARAKLAAADAKYKQSINETTTTATSEVVEMKKKARRKKAKQTTQGMMDDNHESETSEEEEEPQSLHERREAKLKEMREKIEEAKKTEERQAAAAEEAMRAQLLNEETQLETGPTLKRKRIETTDKSSLIANLQDQATPPHDFSQKLELKNWAGMGYNFDLVMILMWRRAIAYTCTVSFLIRQARYCFLHQQAHPAGHLPRQHLSQMKVHWTLSFPTLISHKHKSDKGTIPLPSSSLHHQMPSDLGTYSRSNQFQHMCYVLTT